MSEIGERIKTIRKDRGLSINKFAKQAGVSKSYVSNIERGVQENPSLGVLDKMASTLNVSIQDLLSGEGYIRQKKEKENEVTETS
ncbi:helix-turn-helix domain-containing protein [Halobacillus massiliensis]|uniref:helix-turn-helix domain-containing protein n=1 Tax=Halobacillus massiliensis TaxID=1926286 RepID=UPI0009E40580|nr:helix-turn-helix transcriptional regulator [Halobacillus massiliensis]